MPRRSRKLSNTGVYHVMLRGNEKKDVFADEEDKSRIIDTIFQKRSEDGFKLYAFCVMDNHLHLVLQEAKETVSKTVKRFGTSYAYYYNNKHKRVGHVFQDRFKSECVTNEGQLLEVIRYVHNNPVKASMVESASDYPWSSYNDYTGRHETGKRLDGEEKFMEDMGDILGIFSKTRVNAVEQFRDFTKQRTEMMFLEEDISDREQDEEEIRNKVVQHLQWKGIGWDDMIKDKARRDEIIRMLKFEDGFSGRRIAGVLGIDRNMVQRVKGNGK